MCRAGTLGKLLWWDTNPLCGSCVPNLPVPTVPLISKNGLTGAQQCLRINTKSPGSPATEHGLSQSSCFGLTVLFTEVQEANWCSDFLRVSRDI